jgi:hypothetical protein
MSFPGGGEIFLRAATFAVALLCALTLAEVGVRVSGVATTGGVVTVTESDFHRVPGIFEPGQVVVDRRIPELAFQVNVNSLGYRGHDFPIAKGPAEVRVLMIGDSFTFGDFVNDDETLPAQLASALRCDVRVTVINAGVGGSSIDTHRQMATRGLAIDPDLVVLTFYENDIADMTSPLWAQLERNRAAKSQLPLSIVYPVARHLAIWNLVNSARARWASRRRPDWNQPVTASTEVDDHARHDSLRAIYEEEFRDLVALMRQRNVGFMLATYPSHGTWQRKNPSENLVWVEGMAKNLGIPVVAFLEPLTAGALPVEALYALPLDGHPRPRAYAAAAAHLAHAISSYVLPHRCPRLEL